ncbi:hypothetical protein QTN24_12120 [Cupriavidus sp. SZY C1]|uniref:hypothetical protein n=1 Tax=Cupriavidus sp. SZY C1 TaxID=3055037 RepID=UPI0028B43BBE|nr:hypothetical protein [Cupriavidus sp. SZY C1]MDT6962244.1 hypothetical protein [Cupriavidus sp. SZY C1]
MAQKKSAGAEAFLSPLISLYFTEKVTPTSSELAVKSLPPNEALVLGLMCLEGHYNAKGIRNRLCEKYGALDPRECDVVTEAGILGLMALGYLRPSSKAAEKALNERDMAFWGLGDVAFIVTAKGAKRISYVVGSVVGENAKDVAKRVQAESKEQGKRWAESHAS